jgi:hypothetical protein
MPTLGKNTAASNIFRTATQKLDLNCSGFPVQGRREVQSMD